MKRNGFSLRNSPKASDGTWVSEVIYNDEETLSQPIADDLQTDCRGVADDLQTSCVDVADTSQTSCTDVADDLQTSCTDIAEPPQKTLRTPLPALNEQLIKYLADDSEFQKAVYGHWANVEEFANSQRTAPKALAKHLQALGFDVNIDSLSRNYLPAARVERERKNVAEERKQKHLWMKISAGLAIALVIVWCATPSRSEMMMNRVEVSATSESDSAIYWDKMVEYIEAYNKGSRVKIYPFSYPTLYERINKKNIRDVKGYKQEFDFRIEEIKKNQNN